MAFVVDGSEWKFDGWTSVDVLRAIDQVLARIAVARSRDEAVWIGDDFQSRPMLGLLDLWSLCSPGAPVQIPAEQVQELSAWLGRSQCYVDEPWPEGFPHTDVQVQNEPSSDNPDVAWAHHNVRGGRHIACLGIHRTGPMQTTTPYGGAIVYWVTDERTNRCFWRNSIKLSGNSAAELEQLSSHAFPDLYFHQDVWSGISDFDGGYAALSSTMQWYLEILDDHGHWAFTFPPPALAPGEPKGPNAEQKPTNQIIQRRFVGFNLDMAPENPNVYADIGCRKARQRTVGARTLYCEWHGKLEPHRNRIHIHPPVPESGNKVVVAIFHAHLPLP